MNAILITGLVCIVLYFVLYHFIQRKKYSPAKSSNLESSRNYSDLLNFRLKEDIILISAWGLLVIGIFLSLSGLRQ